MAMVFFRFSYLDFAILTLINQSINLFNSGNEKNHKHTVEFYLYPTVSTVLIHSVKPELTE